MSRSPIEAMIDAACKCVKCGTAGAPGTCGCWVRLRCPKCQKSRLVEKDEFDPPGTATVQIDCPECNSGDFASPAYFDAAGRELFWEEGDTASGIETEGHDREDGHGAEHESPAPKADAQ